MMQDESTRRGPRAEVGVGHAGGAVGSDGRDPEGVDVGDVGVDDDDDLGQLSAAPAEPTRGGPARGEQERDPPEVRVTHQSNSRTPGMKSPMLG